MDAPARNKVAAAAAIAAPDFELSFMRVSFEVGLRLNKPIERHDSILTFKEGLRQLKIFRQRIAIFPEPEKSFHGRGFLFASICYRLPVVYFVIKTILLQSIHNIFYIPRGIRRAEKGLKISSKKGGIRPELTAPQIDVAIM
jgi:hypothetical protein